jgi:formamidopyrimidine-DNA glycosylase
VTGVERRGKNILVRLSGNKTILIHMKMTGHLLYGTYLQTTSGWHSDEPLLRDPFNQFIHLVFSLSNGKHLAFSDMRKFAKVFLFETDTEHLVTDISSLGPDPLTHLTVATLETQLHQKPNGKIKSVLMDQNLVAGIGNIYSDEILWDSGIHPEHKVSELSKTDYKNIFKSMQHILQCSIDMGGDSMSDYRNIYGEKGNFQNAHKVYRRTKQKCMKRGCTGTICRKIIGGRSAHFCDTHQK